MRKKLTERALYVLLAVLIVTVLLLYLPKFLVRGEHLITELNSWSYTDAQGQKVDITLPQKLYQDENGVCTIYTPLPEQTANSQYICFWTFYSAVEVSVNDRALYFFDNSSTDSFGQAPSSKWHFVELKSGIRAGDTLTIKMTTPYTDINLRMTEIVCGDLKDIHGWLESSYGFYRLLDNAFTWVGILFVLLAFIQKVDLRHKLYQLYAGLTLILFSLYVQTGTKSMPIYWMSNYLREFLSMFSLLATSIPLTLYIRARVQRKPKMTLWCDILLLLEAGTVVTLFLLHGLGVLDLHKWLGLGLLWLFASVITGIVFSVWYMIRERNRFNPLTLVSLSLIAVVMAVEYVQFYQLSSLPFDTGFLSHMGAIAVIGVESAAYILYLRRESILHNLVHEENRSLQIQMLTSQIRPHFILNTIGAIRNLIHEQPDRASDLLYEFSKYIRNNLEHKDYTKPVPFPEELNYINTYLKLEKARFSDRLNVIYDIGTRDFWVLPLTIQPFVENAVKHGLFPSRNGGTLTISTRRMWSTTVIEIRDDGVGFDTATLSSSLDAKKSVGMRSAILRLENEMGGKVQIQSSRGEKSGTCVHIELPVKKEGRK